jgi:hypothetical protein
MGAVMNERAIALINAEIDGVLTGPERAELNRLLLADPAIRSLRDGLRRTCESLDAVQDEEIPADLHESILSALPASPIRCDEATRSGRFGRPVLRYAAAFAGGLLVSALAFHFAGVETPGFGPHELAGTIAPAAATSLQIDLPQVKGQVTLTGSAAQPVVVSRLAATTPVAVVARMEGREVHLDGFVAPQEAPIEMSARLGTAGAAGPVVEIRVIDMVSGAVLHAAALRPNVPD